MADRRRKDGDSPTLMVPTRTCVACEMSKPWRDMVKWTPDRELEKRWTSALTPNDNEQRILDAKLDGLRGKNQTIYVCESHFDRDRCFKLTPSGFMLRPNSVPVDVRKLLNDRSSQNAPSSSNNQDMPPPSPLTVHALTSPSPSSRGGGKRSKDMDEMEMMPPPKMMPPPPNTIDITGTTAELMAQNGGAGEMRGVNGEQLMNMGGEASATVKIEEIEDDEQLTWVNSVIPLETPEERENRLAAEQAAQMEAAATMASMFAAVVPQPPVDTVDDCINSVIRNALEPPQVPQSDLLKPKLTYETLCYEAFEFIEQNFKQSSLKMSDICHYISHKYRYFASGIMWRKQVFRALNTADYINVERLDKPDNKEDDSLYTLNRTEYDYRTGQDGEVRVRWRKKNKNPTQQPNHSMTVDNDEERNRMNNRAIPEASDDITLFTALANTLGVPPTTG